MTYKLERLTQNATFMVVGCGGTGGFVAEGLCRLLVGRDSKIFLVDHDRVEEHNLARQNFFQQDLGRFKSQVLAERLARNYNREIGYLVSPIQMLPINERCTLTIGCVDNAEARERLQYTGAGMMGQRYSYRDVDGWYIDAGNSEHSGQVLIGNSLLRQLGQSFFNNGAPFVYNGVAIKPEQDGLCRGLPLPTLQEPALLAPTVKPIQNCAEAVQHDEQSPVINQMMAALVLQFVHLLMKGELSWMGAYIDLESGSLSTVPAEPETVARMTGLSLKKLVYHPRPVKEQVRVRV